MCEPEHCWASGPSVQLGVYVTISDSAPAQACGVKEASIIRSFLVNTQFSGDVLFYGPFCRCFDGQSEAWGR